MPRSTLEQRFWAKVNKTETCWIWTGASIPKGYGKIRVAGRLVYAHRLAYELNVGPIPEGMQIDHLCRNPACVRPSHLEPVTARENLVRGVGFIASQVRQTHCKRGHEYTAENTYWQGRKRSCLTCRRDYERTRPDRRRA